MKKEGCFLKSAELRKEFIFIKKNIVKVKKILTFATRKRGDKKAE
ncbi:hypothetical protein [Mucilaginibacter gracilis]|nr:hypothetical protein [Mucilaginibacter gracilis]